MLARRALTLLSLNPGEGRTVGLAVAMTFLGSGGMMIAQSSIDALFFARYGAERLPVMYLLVGIAMFFTTLAVGLALAKRGRERTFVLILGGICVVALAARARSTGAPWVYGALWVVYNVAESTELLALWGIAGLVANTREAKRFFPLIAAGSVLGVISAGLATGPLASTFGSEPPRGLGHDGSRRRGKGVWLVRTRSPGDSAITPGRAKRASVLDGFRDVRRSELLRWISVGALIDLPLFSLLYLPFSAAAAERYPDADELAGFFGFFFAVSMGTALVLSLLVTSRLLTRFGVPVVILVLPTLYLAAFGYSPLRRRSPTHDFPVRPDRVAQRWRWQYLGDARQYDFAGATGPGAGISLGRPDATRDYRRGCCRVDRSASATSRRFSTAQGSSGPFSRSPRSRACASHIRARSRNRCGRGGRRSSGRPLVRSRRASVRQRGGRGAREPSARWRSGDTPACGVCAGRHRRLCGARPAASRNARSFEEVRVTALESLERLAPETAAESARAALHDASPSVRFVALAFSLRSGLAPKRIYLTIATVRCGHWRPQRF